MSLLSRMLAPFVKKTEGEPVPGPWRLPVSGGWLSAEAGNYMNWWQLGYDIDGPSQSALVEACVSAYAQTISMCPGDHWRSTDDGGRERIGTSALARILRSPNAYQTISDFLLNAVSNLYDSGNAYAVAFRNSRFEISELHLMDPVQCAPQVAVTGDIFYALAGNDVVDRAFDYPLLVPARDVLHIKLKTSRHNMLVGVSPIEAVAADIAASGAINAQQVQFYLNQARPATVLSTEMLLDATQVQQLRDRWNEQSRGINAGGTPILTAGLKPVPISTTGRDAEIAEMLKISQQNIALAFRVPLQILGIGGTPLGSTEALMQAWIGSGLGFCLNHVEEAFGKLFGLYGQPDEYVEFNTKSLLRSAQKDRIDALVRGVQGGVYSPNEARAEEDLPKVKFGDEPRVQQQVVPLSAAAGIPSAPAAPASPAAPPVPLKLPAPSSERGSFDESSIRRRFRAAHARSV